MRSRRKLTLLLLFLPVLLSAQDNRVFYFPKPVERTPWQPPMKPVTRLADVKARHKGEPSWPCSMDASGSKSKSPTAASRCSRRPNQGKPQFR